MAKLPIEDWDPGDPGGDGNGGGGGESIPDSLPGLGNFLRRRYTLNLLVNEEIPVIDLITDPIAVAARLYLTQGVNGKVKCNIKQPVDWCLGTTAFAIGDTELAVDNAYPWVESQSYLLLIDPHTDESEIRIVTEAVYDTDQNSVTLTSDDADISITGFSGCDGASTPADALITVNAVTASTTYTIALDGIDLPFTTSGADTTVGVAAFIAGMIAAHPGLDRRFRVVYNEGESTVALYGRFGTLTLNEALTKAHVAPESDPATAPTLATSAGPLDAGEVRVAYAYKNEHGQTLLSPFKAVTLTGSQQIDVSAVTPPAGCTVVWYASARPGGSKLRYLEENNGAAFSITQLPRLTASLPPDINRTGTEMMRVKAAFSDRESVRSNTERANVLRGTFEWFLGKRNKRYNVVELKYRDQGQDYRLVNLRLRDDEHIAKVHKQEKLEVNGQGIDNYFQAYRIAAGILGEQMEADFFYKWNATRTALLLEEGDVVAITDSGSGVINFPVWIETMEIDPGSAGLPSVSFVGRKYANSLWDDSVVERIIPIVVEYDEDDTATPPTPVETYFLLDAEGDTLVDSEGDPLTFS
jgi:hypothetical protein